MSAATLDDAQLLARYRELGAALRLVAGGGFDPVAGGIELLRELEAELRRRGLNPADAVSDADPFGARALAARQRGR
ncbi:MAG: hypothetical protein IPJ65_43945 [Archangiaceae bacterium]|nr:hypothetical protein [Archangiaceae bacterium]